VSPTFGSGEFIDLFKCFTFSNTYVSAKNWTITLDLRGAQIQSEVPALAFSVAALILSQTSFQISGGLRDVPYLWFPASFEAPIHVLTHKGEVYI
jgi:hypothetical protein